jgi:hypothetical protein
MGFLTINITSIFKIIIISLLFQTALLGTTIENESSEAENSFNQSNTNYTEVSLDSFGDMGIGIVLVVTSLLGAFFLRNELDGAI